MNTLYSSRHALDITADLMLQSEPSSQPFRSNKYECSLFDGVLKTSVDFASIASKALKLSAMTSLSNIFFVFIKLIYLRRLKKLKLHRVTAGKVKFLFIFAPFVVILVMNGRL